MDLASLGLNMPILKSKLIISQTLYYLTKAFYPLMVNPPTNILTEYWAFSPKSS